MAAPLLLPKDIVVMGHVIAPHGVKGWLKIKVFTESFDSLLQFSTWWIRGRNQTGDWDKLKITDAKVREYGLVALFDGIDDRTAADKLKGYEIGISRSDFPEVSEGEFYWADLIGLSVVNTQNEVLGTVTGLIETGANDVLVVESKSADAHRIERLIPYIDSVILSVNLTEKKIIADWGLDY